MNPARITRCRVCGNPSLLPVMNIGDQYLSSIFPTDLSYRASLQKMPLDILLCEKRPGTCGLPQLAHENDLSEMYVEYPYTSSSNSSMRKVLEDVVVSGKALKNLSPGDTVLDIGCNDGTLLSFFANDPCELVGIDPAQNVALTFHSPRFTHRRDFFSRDSYFGAAKKKAKLVFSCAMFYHLSDPVRFARDMEAVLDEDGVAIVQMAYLPAMIRTNMYDNIVHEHVGYYGTHHLKYVMEQAGLEIYDVLLNDVYGGSFRTFIKKKGCSRYPVTPRLEQNYRDELAFGIYEPRTYTDFMRRISDTREELVALCRDLKQQGKRIWVYGASTKGNTIMQFCGIDHSLIDAAADSNPFKLGKWIIGSDIPIKSEEEMRQVRPDYLLALPYSFVGAFRKREAALVEKGTRFIVPLPDVQVA